jgi:ribosomal protein S27AE
VPLLNEHGNLIQMITVCAHCGASRTILLLTRDRWYCSKCRAEGVTAPTMFPIA